MRANFRWVVLLVGGVGLLGAGIGFAEDGVRFLRDSARAEGVVVELVARRVRGNTLYRPVVRFQPVGHDGSIEFTAPPGLWPSPFEVGDRVEVAYRVDDPADARVVSFWTLWFLPGVMTAFGAGCLFASWHDRRQRHREAVPDGAG